MSIFPVVFQTNLKVLMKRFISLLEFSILIRNLSGERAGMEAGFNIRTCAECAVSYFAKEYL